MLPFTLVIIHRHHGCISKDCQDDCSFKPYILDKFKYFEAEGTSKLKYAQAFGVKLAGELDKLTVFYIIAFAYLVLTPTMHPWYALYMVVLLPFAAGSGGLALPGLTLSGLTLSWSVILVYRVLIPFRLTGFWIEDDMTAFMVVLAPAAAFLSVMVVPFIYRHLRIQVD